ncbi:RNA polymerase sigma factor [Paenibacillus profundus]|uniref:RNA polymerase sigma factor n=1 Tax=Paenibacillus profundus TaxID=1173085 RepID=A0ABS8YIW1_9BACL|nr:MULTISPECIES: RNA polymerase sigma factor [Paenibacillus]MCE5169479.1 RNA polymerase sigma factor [Paenibacillus profundus]MCM3341259.1 RNA polymerase sigma factor [Paenibacillus sp. MER TA 81-3]
MISDEQLVKAMADGDEAAFETLVRRYHAPIQAYAERMLHDRRKAEDTVQETFLRLIRQMEKGTVPEQVRPWLYRVAGNLCKDQFRKQEVRKESLVDDFVEEAVRNDAGVLQLVERQETRRELLRVMNKLSATQRQIVTLRFYHDLKLQEISDALDMGLSAVKASLYSALRKLKTLLNQEGEPSPDEKEEIAHGKR